MNYFGGDWTKQKIEIVVSYAKAYLTIMNVHSQLKCLYFDGFAGSGDIYKESKTDIEVIKGTAIRILEIDKPKPFDIYYFVELNKTNEKELKETLRLKFANKDTYIVCDDCNKKLSDMADFLKKEKSFRALAFIDPFGMSLNWSSIVALKGLGVDLWILVPTGIGINRLLKKNGEISDALFKKLEQTLGLNATEIRSYFYRSKTENTLFGDVSFTEKESDAINKIGSLYRIRLNEIFKFVSEALPLKNSTNSIMYHFMLASNNAAALKIANGIIKVYK